jgi:hypothetical protein
MTSRKAHPVRLGNCFGDHVMTLIVLATALALSAASAQTAPQQTEPAADAPRLGGLAPPTGPFVNGPPPPGAQVVFVPNPKTPTEMFPPPPPRENVPFCKRNQFDGCKQRGG